MSKISVPITECNVGEVLAEDVHNGLGAILVPKNTIVNHYLKAKLSETQRAKVCLYKPDGTLYTQTSEEIRKNYGKAVISVKALLYEVSYWGKVDYQKVKSLSEFLAGGFHETSNILEYLTEIKSSDEYTYNHCINVALYSMLIARWLNLSETQIQEVMLAGLLHDLGKIKIPDYLLNKNGKLTFEEYHVMKRHSRYGYEIIKDIAEISLAVKMAVLTHHERFDGTGYPLGLSGYNINLYARIIAIADVFDAMTQNRIYKEKVSPFETLKMFKTIGTSNFDPKLLSIFIYHISPYYVGTKVKLSNGETGEIVYIPLQDITNPVIKVEDRYINLSLESNLTIASFIL